MADAHRQVSPARVFARPTADQIWLGPAQRAALSQLSQPARARVLLGAPSSGKSTLLSHIAARWSADHVVLACRGPKADAGSLLTALLLSADLAPWELSEVEQRNLLTVFVQQRRSQSRRVTIVIDDAQNLSGTAWTELERLLLLTVDRKPALDILLSGPESLLDFLQSSTVGGLGKDLCVYRLDWPSQTDLIAYVDWRLGRFEMSGVVTPMATQMIAKLSGARYGAADVLCQMALLLQRRLRVARVDTRVVRQAATLLATRQGVKSESEGPLEAEHSREGPPLGYLLVSRGGTVMSRITLGQRTLIGRSEHNDVCLPSPYLSRHHAVVVGTPEGYYVVDLNSMNGIVLNGQRVERAVLCDQDLLAIGPFRLKVQIPEWLAEGDPIPAGESLADTALMPPDQPTTQGPVRRVK